MINSDYYSGYKKCHTALLIQDSFESFYLPEWEICNLDEFYNNLDMWSDKNDDPVDVLFSRPIPGIKQNLANIQDYNVGAAGLILKTDKEFLNKLTEKYNKSGYLVIIVGEDTRFLYPTKLQSKVKINLKRT